MGHTKSADCRLQCLPLPVLSLEVSLQHNAKLTYRALDKREYLVIIRDNFC